MNNVDINKTNYDYFMKLGMKMYTGTLDGYSIGEFTFDRLQKVLKDYYPLTKNWVQDTRSIRVSYFLTDKEADTIKKLGDNFKEKEKLNKKLYNMLIMKLALKDKKGDEK